MPEVRLEEPIQSDVRWDCAPQDGQRAGEPGPSLFLEPQRAHEVVGVVLVLKTQPLRSKGLAIEAVPGALSRGPCQRRSTCGPLVIHQGAVEVK